MTAACSAGLNAEKDFKTYDESAGDLWEDKKLQLTKFFDTSKILNFYSINFFYILICITIHSVCVCLWLVPSPSTIMNTCPMTAGSLDEGLSMGPYTFES